MSNRSIIYKSNIDLQNKNSARVLGIDFVAKIGAVVLDVGCVALHLCRAHKSRVRGWRQPLWCGCNLFGIPDDCRHNLRLGTYRFDIRCRRLGPYSLDNLVYGRYSRGSESLRGAASAQDTPLGACRNGGVDEPCYYRLRVVEQRQCYQPRVWRCGLHLRPTARYVCVRNILKASGAR